MPEFINRARELAELRRLARGDGPALVVLRGRRRIGKSRLLHEAIPTERLVSFQADEQDESGHLELLARESARLLPRTPPLAFADWDAALAFFGSQASDGPIVVVLDEFQYLCSAQPALPSMIQRHWDAWDARGTPVCLVLAGSALSFMQGLLDHGAPLFGRATYRPLLLPLDYRDASEFAPAGTSSANLLRRYALLGGTPQYQVWAGPRSVSRLLRDAILTKGQPLYEEPLQLLRGEQAIRDPRTYFGMLRAVAESKNRTGEIASAVGLDSSQTTKFLNRLTELGYIELREPLAAGREAARAIWRIADPYFRFWFRYVFRNRSRLERELVHEVQKEIEADLETYMGWEFEEACRAWVARYSTVGADSTAVGSWWSRRGDAEIDVVAMRGHAYTLVGSCKWTARVDERVLDQLYGHRALLGGRAARARLVLFARDGFAAALDERAQAEDVALVTAETLFSGDVPPV